MHNSSASGFATTRLEAVELDQQSLSLRKKKILKRDDSGIFSSSPSPQTPSRDPHAVFSPLAPATVDEEVMSNGGSRSQTEQVATDRPVRTAGRLLDSTDSGASHVDNQSSTDRGNFVSYTLSIFPVYIVAKARRHRPSCCK